MISLMRRRRVPAVALALGTFAASISTYICILSSAQAGPGSPDPRLVNPDGARGEPDKGLANPAGARGETDEGLANQTRAWRTRRGPGEPDEGLANQTRAWRTRRPQGSSLHFLPLVSLSLPLSRWPHCSSSATPLLSLQRLVDGLLALADAGIQIDLVVQVLVDHGLECVGDALGLRCDRPVVQLHVLHIVGIALGLWQRLLYRRIGERGGARWRIAGLGEQDLRLQRGGVIDESGCRVGVFGVLVDRPAPVGDDGAVIVRPLRRMRHPQLIAVLDDLGKVEDAGVDAVPCNP